MDEAERSYIPAFGKRWLLPLYDPMLWLFGADSSKRPLIEQAEIKPGHRVLDIGCGTGSLAALIKRGFRSTLALDDGAAAHFVGTRLKEVVSSRPKARAFQVTLRRGVAVETQIPVRYLGGGK